MSKCKSCDAEIIWVKTEKGKSMPIDAEPSVEGQFLKVRVDENGTKHVQYLGEREAADCTRPLYLSHFATCPDAGIHRQ